MNPGVRREDLEGVYAEFLNAADLHVWRKCLDRYAAQAQVFGTEAGMDLDALAQGLCIAYYTRWFAILADEEATRVWANETFELLAKAAGRQNLERSRAGVRVNALIAAGRGYPAAARALIEAAGTDVPIEVSLLMTPQAPSRVAQILAQPVAEDRQGGLFLPAVMVYADALIELGYLQQAQAVLERYSAAASNPLLIDLQGKLYELSGAWEKAQSCYSQSKAWAVHKYRAAICAVIVQVSKGQAVDLPWADTDESLQKAMLSGGSESDQAEVARAGSFVNVCRWYNFDNWLVHYELGSLSFRRKRHTEAEKHLSIAARQAPATVAFAVNHLRFINLTWLGSTAMGQGLPVKPETLECAHATLQARGPEDVKATIRTWLAAAVHDPTCLQPVYQSDDLFAQGEAYEFEGNTPAALQRFSQSAAQSYLPRAYHHLIESLAYCGFEETTCYLIDITMDESWEDFFQLWELGKALVAILHDKERYFTLDHISERFARIEERLEQLAGVEFQHLMRVWRFYLSYDRGDLAVRALQQADQLAESPEELLLLATARRDRSGLLSLLRAEGESTHRLERLEIARELAQRGQINRARRILQSERVFEPGEALSPLEFVLVLECGSPCLSKDEISVLSERAVANLVRDQRAGLFGPYAGEFMKRLRDHIEVPSSYLSDWLTESASATEKIESEWKSWQSTLDKHPDPERLEQQRRRIESQLSESDNDEAELFFSLAIWGPVFRNLDALLGSIRGIRPNREPDQTPISRTDSIATNLRAKTVSRLWRDYLNNRDEEQAERLLDQVKAFYRDEQRLRNEWDTLRRNDMQGPLETLRYLVEAGQGVLDRIGRCVRHADLWPPFLRVREHMLRDIDALRERLSTQMNSVGPDY